MRPALLALCLLALPASAAAQGLHLIPGVAEIPTDTIRDVAIADVYRADPVIYYNPRRFGPLLTRFFVAHEYGHIALQHSRLKLMELQAYLRDSTLRSQELDADCYAASLTGDDARNATEAAIRFFSRMGQFTFDTEHPTGSQRVSTILSCLPEPRQAVLFGRGDTGVDKGPVSGEPERVQFVVRSPNLSTLAFGTEATVWIDGERLGEISNMRVPQHLAVERFGVGIHSYRISLRVYTLDQAQQFSLDGSVMGRGQVLVQAGVRFLVQWSPGQQPRLERDLP